MASRAFYEVVRILGICVSLLGLLLIFGGIALAFSGGLGYAGIFFGLPGFFVAVLGSRLEEWAKNKRIEEEFRTKTSEASDEGTRT